MPNIARLVFIIIILIASTIGYTMNKIYKNLIKVFIANKILRLILLLSIFSLIIFCLLLFFKQKVNKQIKHLAYFLIFSFIFMSICFVSIDILKLFGIKLNLVCSTLTIILLSILVTTYGYINRTALHTTRYTIESSKKIKLKIIFISDIHIGALGINTKILQKMVNIINKNEPDIVLFGGDIIESKISQNIIEYSEILKNIKSKFGKYGVLGNHEYYGGESNKMVEFFDKNADIEIIMDNYKIVDKNITIIGRQDASCSYYDKDRKTIREIIGNNNIKSENFTILLDHNPQYYNETVENNLDLQLSGHTHNGQFFPFNLLVKLAYEKPYGKLTKNNSNLIVSSGVGSWGPPIKIFSPSEIVIVEINQ